MNIRDELVCVVRSSEIAPDPRAERLAGFLTGEGARVIILGLNRSGRSARRESLMDFKVERLTMLSKRSLPDGKITLAPFLVVWALWAFLKLLQRRPSVVIGTDFDSMLPCLLYSLITRSELVYDPHDFWADNFRKPMPRFVAPVVSYLDKRLVRYSAALILPDISRIAQYSGALLPERIVEIVNTPSDLLCPSTSDFELGVPIGKMIVFFGGRLGVDRGLLSLIRVVDREPQVHAVIAGYGEEEDQVVAYIRNHKNCTFLGRLSHDRVMSLTRISDVVFAMYNPEVPNNVFASPNKLFEAMACGKPVVVNDGTRLADLVRMHNCGIIVPYDDDRKLASALRELQRDRDIGLVLGENGLRAYEENYTWEEMELRLRTLFDSL